MRRLLGLSLGWRRPKVHRLPLLLLPLLVRRSETHLLLRGWTEIHWVLLLWWWWRVEAHKRLLLGWLSPERILLLRRRHSGREAETPLLFGRWAKVLLALLGWVAKVHLTLLGWVTEVHWLSWRWAVIHWLLKVGLSLLHVRWLGLRLRSLIIHHWRRHHRILLGRRPIESSLRCCS